MKASLLICILAFCTVFGICADTPDFRHFINGLQEAGKIPDTPEWETALQNSFQTAGGKIERIHPLTYSILGESISPVQEEADPEKTADLFLQTMLRIDEEMKRGSTPARLQQEARRELQSLGGIRPANRTSDLNILQGIEGKGRDSRPFGNPADQTHQGEKKTDDNSARPGPAGTSGGPVNQGSDRRQEPAFEKRKDLLY